MKCAVHPEVDATGFCRNCGKALCAECARPVREVLYCENCLAAGMGMTAPQLGHLALRPANLSGAFNWRPQE